MYQETAIAYVMLAFLVGHTERMMYKETCNFVSLW